MVYFTEEQDEQWRATQPKKMIVAKVVIRTANGKVLLVKPSYKPTWQLLGGGVDAGESPATAAVREIHEEIGAVCSETDLRLVDTVFRSKQDILILIYQMQASWTEEQSFTLEDELDIYKWVDLTDVAARLPDYYKEFCRTYLVKK